MCEEEDRDKDEFCSDLNIQQGKKSIKCIDIIKNYKYCDDRFLCLC